MAGAASAGRGRGGPRGAPRRAARAAGRVAAAAAALLATGAARAFVGGVAAPRLPARPAPRARPAAARPAVGPEVAGAAEGRLTLRYFDARGVAETARVLLAVAGADWEDHRYPITFGTPGDFKTIQREEFEEDRASGKMDVAMGKVPVLDVGGFSLPQSKAIERYLAARFGLMGSTPEEAAWVDAVAEHVRDISDAYAKKGIFFMKDGEKKKEIEEKWFGEELPEMMGRLEGALPSKVAGFAVGDKVSYADVLIFRQLKDSYGDREAAALAPGCPKLLAIAEKVGGLKPVSSWLESRPKTMF